MARPSGPRRAAKDAARRGVKKKVCVFCKDHVDWVDYKDVNLLRRFMSERGKIRARRVSGNCAQHQRAVAVAIKTARELALLPYTQRTVAERGGGRGRGPGRGRREAAVDSSLPEGVEEAEEVEEVEELEDGEGAEDIDEVEEVEGSQEADSDEGGEVAAGEEERE
ncbi:MAG: 30S ribosomal protein S18 [Chloroflexi bacterium]|nr:30S ribosomal protein S18 [Chloroflexota bacterium]